MVLLILLLLVLLVLIVLIIIMILYLKFPIGLLQLPLRLHLVLLEFDLFDSSFLLQFELNTLYYIYLNWTTDRALVFAVEEGNKYGLLGGL